MKKIIKQAPIVRYRASVSEIFFPDFFEPDFFRRIDMLTISFSSRKHARIV